MWAKIFHLYKLEMFAIRAIIFVLIFSLSQFLLVKYINYVVNKESSEKIKIYLKGLINNPEVFYIRAKKLYDNKKYIKARTELNFALGLIGYRCTSSNMKICDLSKKIDLEISK